MDRKITVTGVNFVFFAFVVLYLLFQAVLLLLGILYGEAMINSNVYKILLINQYIIVLLPVLAYTLCKRLNIKETFRLNRIGAVPGLLAAGITIPAYFVASMLNALVVYFLQFLGRIPEQPIPVPDNVPELLSGLLIVALSPAICEELMHRGLMLKAYERRGSMRAVAITGIFFGLFHFDITNLLGPILLGLLFGYFVIRTNSIYPAMIAHLLTNSIFEIFQFFWGTETASQGKTAITLQELGPSVLYGVIGLIFMLMLLRIFNRVTESTANALPPISSPRKDFVSIITHWPIAVIVLLYFLMSALYIVSIAMA